MQIQTDLAACFSPGSSLGALLCVQKKHMSYSKVEITEKRQETVSEQETVTDIMLWSVRTVFLFVNALDLVKINNLVTGNSGGAAEDVHKETENKSLLPTGEDATQQMAFPGYQDCQCTCVKKASKVCVGVSVCVSGSSHTYIW